MTEHTPTPWAIGERERLIVREVPGMCDGGDCYSVAETKFHSLLLQDEAAANAAFIVKAVNNHDALVARVKYLEATEANEILRLKTALKECAMRCRYDGDLFHDQGNIQRRDASWKAQEDAEAILASVSSPQGGE